MKEARCETGWRLSSSRPPAFVTPAPVASVLFSNSRERRGGRDAHRDAVDARKGGGVAEREEERKIGGAL